MDLIKAVDWNRSCPVIRAYVQMNSAAELSAGCPEGYCFYWKNRKMGYVDWNLSDLSQFEKNQSYEVCWIKRNNRIIVPWGIGQDAQLKAHGEIVFFLNGIRNIEKFLKNFPLAWEQKTEGGVLFEYLSEYFIDSDGRQNGISIRLREMILSQYREEILNFIGQMQNSGCSNWNVNDFLKEKIGTEYEKYGLTLERADKGGAQ